MSNKAIPRSVSFKPGSLYAEAVAYGERQTEQIDASKVVCRALRLLFKQEAKKQAKRKAAA